MLNDLKGIDGITKSNPDKLIKVKAMSHYGNWHYYPNNDLAKLIHKTCGKTKTIPAAILALWVEAGYTLEKEAVLP